MEKKNDTFKNRVSKNFPFKEKFNPPGKENLFLLEMIILQ